MSEIRVDRLRKEFKDVVALNDITFSFNVSEVTCLLGPSGCGKTTLMRIIAGLERPTAGEVYFGNDRVTRLAPSKRNIGMVFQYPVVYRGISVYRNIELPLLSDKLSKVQRQERIDKVVHILGLQDSLDKDMTQLDNGTRQKVAVARAVARQPRIILFDEPITNVDANAKLQLKRAFKELTRSLEQTIIYVTHDQTEAMTLADQIALMKDGAIVQCDAPRTLYNEPADVFGGWFLGNPGMDFFDGTLTKNMSADTTTLESPLFAAPVSVSGISGPADPLSDITVGIRPEQIRVSQSPSQHAVQGQITRKSITIGRQYLLTITVGDRTFKAKVEPSVGQHLHGAVWIELPLERISLFDPNGRRISAALSHNGLGTDRPSEVTVGRLA